MNKRLSDIYKKDIADRLKYRKGLISWAKINQRDRKRRKQVAKLIEDGKLMEAMDFHQAALIFQHGETSEDFRRAQTLAKQAIDKGEERARWLYAAATDRWLLSIDKSQRYGTQFVKNENNQWELAQPTDPTVTDEERKYYNVPPLGEALKQFTEKIKQ